MPASDDQSSTASTRGLARWAWHAVQRPRPAELYDAWLFAETDATLALAAWRSATADDKRAAYAAYVAAVDREAHAAGVLELRLAPAA